MRIMSDTEDGNARIEFKNGAIVISSNEQITIIHKGKLLKTISFNELTNAIRSFYLIDPDNLILTKEANCYD